MKRIRIEVCPVRKGGPRWWRVMQGRAMFDAQWRQADAIAVAIALAKKLEKARQLVTLKIKRRDGTIRDERTYPRSSDPIRTRG